MPVLEDFANRLRETRGSGGGADGEGRRLKRLPLGTAFPLLQRTKENADGVGRRDFGSRRVAAEPAAQTSARQKVWRWSEKQDVQCLIPVWFWEGEIRGLRSFRGRGCRLRALKARKSTIVPEMFTIAQDSAEGRSVPDGDARLRANGG